ncbi:MAG: hypothetical protein RR372_03165 [Oscillospiraceae bacterium]
MKKILSRKNGGSSVLVIGLVFVMLLMTMLVMELGGALQNYFTAESILQRSANAALEKNMDDSYRADGILKLKTEQAKIDFAQFVSDDLDKKYTIAIHSLSAKETPPSLTASGAITFPTIFSKYGFESVSFNFKVSAENFEVGHD